MAVMNVPENSPCGIKTTLPKQRRKTQTVAKVESALAEVLKKKVIGFLLKR